MNEEQLKAQLQSAASQMEADGIGHDEIQSFIDEKKDEWRAKYQPEDPIDESVEKPEELVAEDATAVPESTESASDDSSLESPTEVVEDVEEPNQYESQIEASFVNDFNKGITKKENQDAYDKFHETGEFDATLLGSETQARIEANKEDHAKLQKIRDNEGDDAYYAALKEKQEEDALGDGIFNNKLSRSFFNLFERNRLQGTSGGNENLAVQANDRIKALEGVKDTWDPEEWDKEMTKALAIKNANDYLSYEKFDDAREFEKSSAHGKQEIDFVNEDGSWNWDKIKTGALDGTLYNELITQLPNTVIAGLGKNAITSIPGKIFFSAQMANEYRTSLITEKLDGEFGAGKWGQQEYTKFIHENQDILDEAKLYGIGAGQVDRFVDRLTTRGFGSSSIGGKIVGKVAGKLAPGAVAKAAAASKAIKAAVKGPLDKIMKTTAGKVLNNRLTRFAGGMVPETIAEMETEQLQEEIGKALISKSETGQNVAARAFERQANWHFGGKTLYSPEEKKEIGNLRAITGLTAGVMTGGGKAYRGTVDKVKELSLSNQGRKVDGKPMTREEETALRPTESVEANKADIAEAHELNKVMEETQDPEMKAEMLKGIGEKITSIEKRNLNNKEVVSRLASSEISEIQGAKKELTKWEELIGDESLPPTTREIAEKKIAELNEKVDTIYKRPIARALIKEEVDTEQVDEKRRLSDVQDKINELPTTPESLQKYKDLKKKEKDYKDELDKGDLRYQIIPNDPQTEIDSVRKIRADRYVKDPSLSIEESKAASRTFTSNNREKANLKISSLIQDESISGSMRNRAINEFIENNQGIIKKISNKYSGRTRGTNFGSAIERGDIESKLIQEMLTKAQTYNPKGGAKFGTWLLAGLDKKVGNFTTNESGAIRTSRQSKGKAKVQISTQRLVEDKSGFSAEEGLNTGYFEDEDTGSYTGASAGGGINVEEEVEYDSRDVAEDFASEDTGEFDEDINATKVEKTADDYLGSIEYDDNYENDLLGDEKVDDDFDEEEAIEDIYNSVRRTPKKTRPKDGESGRANYTKEDYSAAVSEAIKDFYNLDNSTVKNVKESIAEGLENDSFPDIRQGDKNISSEVAKQTGKPISKLIDKTLGKTQEDKVNYLSENNNKVFNLLPAWAQSGKVFGGLFKDGNPDPEVWENYFGTGGKDGARKLKKFRNALVERVTDTLLDETLEENADLSLVHAEVGMDKISYQVYRKDNDKDLIKGLGDRLKSAWPGVEVIDNQADVDQFNADNNIPGDVGGLFHSGTGTIVLNPSKMGNDTVLHEFSHMWLQGIENSNPELWAKGAELIVDTPIYENIVKRYSQFSQYKDNPKRMLEEAMAESIGIEGTEIFKQKSKANKWDKFVSDVKNWFNNMFGGSVNNNLAEMTLSDFIIHASVEIISGKSVEGAILGNDPVFQGEWAEKGKERAAQVYQLRAGIEEAMKSPAVKEVMKPVVKSLDRTIEESNAMMNAVEGIIDLPSGAVKEKTNNSLVNGTKTLTDWFKVLTVTKPEHRSLLVNSMLANLRPSTEKNASHLALIFTQKPVLKQAVIDSGLGAREILEMIDSLEEVNLDDGTKVLSGKAADGATKGMRSLVEYLNKGEKIVVPKGGKNSLTRPGMLKGIIAKKGKDAEIKHILDSNEAAKVQRGILKEWVTNMTSLVKDGSIDEASARRMGWAMSGQQEGIVRAAVKMEYFHKNTDLHKSTMEHVIPTSAFLSELLDEAFGHNRPRIIESIFNNYVGVNLDAANDTLVNSGHTGLSEKTIESFDPTVEAFGGKVPSAYLRYMNDKIFVNPFDLISYENTNETLASKMGLDPSLEAKFAEAVKNIDNAKVMYQVVNDAPGGDAILNDALKDAKAKNDLRLDRLKFLKNLVNNPQTYKTGSLVKKSKIDPQSRKNLQSMKALLAITEDFNTEDINSLILEASNIIKSGKKTQKEILNSIDKNKDRIRTESKQIIDGIDEDLGDVSVNSAKILGKKKDSFWNKIKRIGLIGVGSKDFYTLLYDMLPAKNREAAKKWIENNITTVLEDANYDYLESKRSFLEGRDAALNEYTASAGPGLNADSGIIVDGISLSNSQVIRIFNHLKDPSLHKQMGDANISTETINQITEHMNNNQDMLVLANKTLDVYKGSRQWIENKLAQKGIKEFGGTKIELKSLSKEQIDVLTAVYGSVENIPEFAPYSPFTSETDQDIDFDSIFKGQNPYSVISGRLKARQGGGTYVFGPKDLNSDFVSYASAGGPLRSAAFLDFAENMGSVLSKENTRKLAALRGDDWVDSMQNSVQRIITGKNISSKDGLSRVVNKWLQYSVAGVMFLNVRSMILQLLSIPNFMGSDPKWANTMRKRITGKLNEGDWKEANTLIKESSWFQDRAAGKTELETAEIFNQESKTVIGKSLDKVHKFGYELTRFGDRKAIALGGTPIVLNKLAELRKAGVGEKEAKVAAIKHFIRLAEEAQQSSRPERLGKEQTTVLGRFVLAFANTPLQYSRLMSRAAKDFKHGNKDQKIAAAKRIAYYSVVQNGTFTIMQQALGTIMAAIKGESDEEEEIEKIDSVVNSMIDTLLRGAGAYGAGAATFKNIMIDLLLSDEKTGPKLQRNTVKAFLNTAPALGTKMRQLENISKAKFYKKSDMSAPDWVHRGANAIAFAGAPADRVLKKMEAMGDFMADDLAAWQKVMRVAGWDRYSLDAALDASDDGGFDTKFDNKKSSFDRIK